MFCKKCGAEIPDGYIFCMNCGTKNESKSNDQETKEKHPKSKKWIIILILTVVIGILIGGTYYYMSTFKRSSGLYGDTKWGMSLEECEQIVNKLDVEGNAVLNEEKDSIVFKIFNYEDKRDIDALMNFNCSKDGLGEIYIYLINGENSSYTNEQLVKEYIEQFDKLYGKNEEDIFTYTWETSKSQIQVVNLTDTTVLISYKDINKIEK